MMFSDARGDDVVVDASDVSSRPDPLSIDGSCASIHWASADWRRSLQDTSRGVRLAQQHLQDRTGERKSTGRDPPRHLRLRQLVPREPLAPLDELALHECDQRRRAAESKCSET